MWSPAGPAPTMQTLSSGLGPGILGKGVPFSPASLSTVESNILFINGFTSALENEYTLYEKLQAEDDINDDDN